MYNVVGVKEYLNNMKNIKERVQLKVFEVEEKERDLLGEAMTEHFKKPCYWVWKKFGRARVERIFDMMQKRDDHEFDHLMQEIHHGQ